MSLPNNAGASPAHLEPSELGTKEYWDALYTTELANHAADPSDRGTNWFDDSAAQDRIVEFLQEHFSSSAPHPSAAHDQQQEEQAEQGRRGGLAAARRATAFLDLGTGNGELLFALREAGWRGRMLGVDYSARSVELARRIEERRQAAFADEEPHEGQPTEEDDDDDDDDNQDDDVPEAREPVEFARHDILLPPPPTPGAADAAAAAAASSSSPSAWPVLSSGAQAAGWDVVLDKGTFDAVSLSSAVDARGRRTGERRYRAAALRLVRPGGLLLMTSCNWTEAELAAWFVGAGDEGTGREPAAAGRVAADGGARFEQVGRIEYRSFSFGGVKGQTISTLCFRKVVVS